MTWLSTNERELMDDLAAQLSERLPSSWRIETDFWETPDPTLRVRWRTPDYRLTIFPPQGRPVQLAVEVKASLTPKEAFQVASALKAQFRSSNASLGMFQEPDGVLLSTTFLSERARELLAETGVSYADSTGNVRIAIDDPPLFIQTSGLDKLSSQKKWPAWVSKDVQRDPLLWEVAGLSDPVLADRQRMLRSFKGPGAALGIRALVDFRPPYGLRELADQAGVSLGTLSRVLDFAEGERLIEREPRGPITGVDWEGFLRRWATDYSLLRSNRVQVFLEPRGIDALLPRLRSYTGKYAVTGSLAAHTVAPEAPAALAVIYVNSLDSAQELGLRATESGGNVMLVQPFPSAQGRQSLAPFVRTRTIDGLEYVSLSQAVVDLLTSPGRGPAEADALIEWMKANEDAWRIT